jgi:hypothetical protein
MEPERRNQLLLGAVAVVLAAAAYGVWPRTSLGPASSSNGTGGVATAPRVPAAGTAAPDVHLPMLEAKRPRPVSAVRNLFRFRPKPPPPPPPPPPVTPVERLPAPVVPTGPAPPPPPPPIVLKFIGTVEAPGQSAQKIAVLSDGRNVFHGREGDIIEGRFRILRIGAESIEMAYLDGRGRQTIRLTGG